MGKRKDHKTSIHNALGLNQQTLQVSATNTFDVTWPHEVVSISSENQRHSLPAGDNTVCSKGNSSEHLSECI